MSYVGGKHAIRREIADLIMRECARSGAREVWEPFCGGLHVTAELGRRGVSVHASDLSKPAITYYRAIRFGWEPPQGGITKAQWETLKQAHLGGASSPMISYAGFSCSFNGIYFASYDGAGRTNAAGTSTQRPLSRFTNLKQRVKASSFATLTCSSYAEVHVPRGAVVYCDPPYANTDASAYRSLFPEQRRFDHRAFWAWCRDQAKHATILVSEYEAPDDAECIWTRTVSTSTKHHTGESGTAVERVFRYREP